MYVPNQSISKNVIVPNRKEKPIVFSLRYHLESSNKNIVRYKEIIAVNKLAFVSTLYIP